MRLYTFLLLLAIAFFACGKKDGTIPKVPPTAGIDSVVGSFAGLLHVHGEDYKDSVHTYSDTSYTTVMTITKLNDDSLTVRFGNSPNTMSMAYTSSTHTASFSFLSHPENIKVNMSYHPATDSIIYTSSFYRNDYPTMNYSGNNDTFRAKRQ